MKQQELKEKRLRSVYKQMYQSWLDFKAQNAATMGKMAELRKEEMWKQKELAEEIEKKLDRSTEIVK